MAISRKHQRFVDEYFLRNMNGTDAYQAVYPKASRESARREASRLLTKVDISEEIQSRLAGLKMEADEVLVRLAEHARGEHSKYLLPSGKVDFAALLADNKGHLVHKIKQTKYGLGIEFQDAQSALVHIGRHLGLFKDVHELTGLNGKPIQITAIEAVKPAGPDSDSDK